MVMGNKELTCVDKLSRSLAGGIQVVRSCTIPGRSRATVHCKVDGGYVSGLGVVESTHGRIRPAHSLNRLRERGEIWVQYVNPFPEVVNLPSGSILGQFYPVYEEDSGPSWKTTAESPPQRPSTGRRANPHHAEMRDGHWAQGVGNGERRGKAKLLHRCRETPRQGDRGGSLNRAARREVPAVAGTVPTQHSTKSKGRGSPQSKPDKQDSREAEHDRTQGQLQQRAITPPEVVHYSRAEPVWTGDLTELRHLQENSPGVVAEVYRAQQEGRRPSDQQLRQGCAELRLYCRRWDSLRIGPNGLLTMSVAATRGLPAGERIVCPTAMRRKLVGDTHKQAHARAQRVFARLQLRWYWPWMESEIRRKVRQCETCQASKHGRPPDTAGRWSRHVERPWQVEAANLADGTPQGDAGRCGRPLPAREVRPPAPKPPPPLLEPSTGSEVQKPPEGGAPYGDTKGNSPSEQYTRQTPVHRKNLVRDRTKCGRYKDSTSHRMGIRANIRGSYEHHANINFCPGGVTNKIHTPETKSPSRVVQPRCSFFPYTDAATGGRT